MGKKQIITKIKILVIGVVFLFYLSGCDPVHSIRLENKIKNNIEVVFSDGVFHSLHLSATV